MGYMRHNAIVVTGWKKDLQLVRDKVSELAARCVYVTEVTSSTMNDHASFLVAPDGSKEGWGESAAGDDSRKRIKEYLRSLAYEDGSTSYDWVEVQFGDDELETKIVDDSDAERRKAGAEGRNAE